MRHHKLRYVLTGSEDSITITERTLNLRFCNTIMVADISLSRQARAMMVMADNIDTLSGLVIRNGSVTLIDNLTMKKY